MPASRAASAAARRRRARSRGDAPRPPPGRAAAAAPPPAGSTENTQTCCRPLSRVPQPAWRGARTPQAFVQSGVVPVPTSGRTSARGNRRGETTFDALRTARSRPRELNAFALFIAAAAAGRPPSLPDELEHDRSSKAARHVAGPAPASPYTRSTRRRRPTARSSGERARRPVQRGRGDERFFGSSFFSRPRGSPRRSPCGSCVVGSRRAPPRSPRRGSMSRSAAFRARFRRAPAHVRSLRGVQPSTPCPRRAPGRALGANTGRLA